MRTIQLTAEMIDDETAVIRGVDCQYMIHLPGVRLSNEWDKACQSMRLKLKDRLKKRRRQAVDEWGVAAKVMADCLRKRACPREVTTAKKVANTWAEAVAVMKAAMRAEKHRQSQGVWETWSRGCNLPRDARRASRNGRE